MGLRFASQSSSLRCSLCRTDLWAGTDENMTSSMYRKVIDHQIITVNLRYVGNYRADFTVGALIQGLPTTRPRDKGSLNRRPTINHLPS